jgi:hypothetical protein
MCGIAICGLAYWQLFSSVPVYLNAEVCQKVVHILAARGAIVIWRAWSDSLCAGTCKKKFIYRPLEARLFSGVPGVV